MARPATKHLHLHPLQKRAWNGRGSITLIRSKRNGDYWQFRKRAIVDNKKTNVCLTLGTTEQIKTVEEARAAADLLVGMGVTTFMDQLRYRLSDGRRDLPRFTSEWYRDKLIEQQGKCGICGRDKKNW